MLTEKLFSLTLLTVSEIPSIAIDPFLQTYFCRLCGNSKINSDDFFNTLFLSSLVVSNATGQNLGFTFDGGDPEADYIVEVGADGNSFSPQDLQIEVGETVQWVNVSGFHNVDGSTDTYPNNPDSFYSGTPSNDAWTYSFTFEIVILVSACKNRSQG